MLGVSEVDEDWQKKPVKTLSGGDYLTFERHKQAQSDKRTGRTPSKNPILLRKSALKKYLFNRIICSYYLQTVWTQIWPNRKLSLISIQTVSHSGGIPEMCFRKSLIEKKILLKYKGIHQTVHPRCLAYIIIHLLLLIRR